MQSLMRSVIPQCVDDYVRLEKCLNGNDERNNSTPSATEMLLLEAGNRQLSQKSQMVIFLDITR